MLDTMQGALTRLGLTEATAEAARNVVEASAADGVIPQPPYVVLGGGGVQPMNDTEDGAVLDTAVAGAADLLITSNLRDFAPGARSAIDADIVRFDADGDADVLLFRHGRLAHGVVIASLFAATAWLLDGARPPDGVLERFLPPRTIGAGP
jgi:hypothetical protein